MVNELTYLGNIISYKGRRITDIQQKMKKEILAFKKFKHVNQNKSLQVVSQISTLLWFRDIDGQHFN